MDYKKRPGIGESLCKTPIETRIKLLNTPVTHEECRYFLQLLAEQGAIPQVRLFFGKENDQLWGTAWYGGKEIILNRRSVEVFLHEAAHFVCKFYFKDNTSHGQNFCRSLDRLIYMWLNHETRL